MKRLLAKSRFCTSHLEDDGSKMVQRVHFPEETKLECDGRDEV